MLFNSLEFAIYLPVVFILYWFVINKNLQHQNLFILTVSYIFYGWWDYRFLSLLFFSSFVDYFIGLRLSTTEDPLKRKLLLTATLIMNLGLLGFFKYFNFFVDSFIGMFEPFGIHLNARTLNIILPVGISFYTFQSLSYGIDVYRRTMPATRNFVSFMAFVSFFPQLVAGPIERASNLLPQFQKTRQFDYIKSIDGLRQMLWGLAKKVILADTCAENVEYIFASYDQLPAYILIFGAVQFAFQIYCDFSGYSDIAIGTAKLFGFNLMRNFAFPYFSRDIAEFWRRWHISLSTWFRDYLYIPLGGSRVNKMKQIRNTLIVFTVSGFWHGANWTFVIWGALNALYFLPLLIAKQNRKYLDIVAKDRSYPTLKEFLNIVLTFSLVLIGWVFFRAENVATAFSYLKGMAGLGPEPSGFSLPGMPVFVSFMQSLVFIPALIITEWYTRTKAHPLENLHIYVQPARIRWLIYVALAVLTLLNFGGAKNFIYFQF